MVRSLHWLSMPSLPIMCLWGWSQIKSELLIEWLGWECGDPEAWDSTQDLSKDWCWPLEWVTQGRMVQKHIIVNLNLLECRTLLTFEMEREETNYQINFLWELLSWIEFPRKGNNPFKKVRKIKLDRRRNWTVMQLQERFQSIPGVIRGVSSSNKRARP